MTRPDDPALLAAHYLCRLHHLCATRIGWATPLHLRLAHRRAIRSTLAALADLEFYGTSGHAREARALIEAWRRGG